MTTGKPDDIREQAKRIYFERCDEVSRLAAQFEEEEVIDLLARAIMAERGRCARIAFCAYERKTEIGSRILRKIRSGVER